MLKIKTHILLALSVVAILAVTAFSPSSSPIPSSISQAQAGQRECVYAVRQLNWTLRLKRQAVREIKKARTTKKYTKSYRHYLVRYWTKQLKLRRKGQKSGMREVARWCK